MNKKIKKDRLCCSKGTDTKSVTASPTPVASHATTSAIEESQKKLEEKRKKENRKHRKRLLRKGKIAIKLLKKQFPKAFASGKDVKPLKIGIHQDLINIISLMPNPPLTRLDCKAAINYYVYTQNYQKALSQPKAVRVDLNGKPIERVSGDHAKQGKALYQRWLNSQKARKQKAFKKQSNKKNPEKT